jgi:hypothetical protein
MMYNQIDSSTRESIMSKQKRVRATKSGIVPFKKAKRKRKAGAKR